MKLNYKKIFIVFCIIFLLAISNVYAVDLFLSNNTNQNTTVNYVEPNDEIELGNSQKSVNTSIEQTDNFNESITTYGNNSLVDNSDDEDETYETTSVQSNSLPTLTTTFERDSSLSVSDVINIILISVCVVLILLAIAILIRCK